MRRQWSSSGPCARPKRYSASEQILNSDNQVSRLLSSRLDARTEGEMDLERIAGALSQALLGAAWLTVVTLTARVFLEVSKADEHSGSVLTRDESEIRRSYATFTFAFMPALAAWLPVFGWMPSSDQLFFPVILTWLVLLVFGALQFHLNLLPAKAALVAVVSMEGGGVIRQVAPSEMAPSAQPRRNV